MLKYVRMFYLKETSDFVHWYPACLSINNENSTLCQKFPWKVQLLLLVFLNIWNSIGVNHSSRNLKGKILWLAGELGPFCSNHSTDHKFGKNVDELEYIGNESIFSI